jgi:hypothetical protein
VDAIKAGRREQQAQELLEDRTQADVQGKKDWRRTAPRKAEYFLEKSTNQKAKVEALRKNTRTSSTQSARRAAGPGEEGRG